MVPDAYVAFAHTDLSKSLSNVNGFTSKWNYPSAATSKVGAEWGVIENVRFFLSSQGLKQANGTNLGNTLYRVMVCAMEAYGCVYQDNFSSRIIYLGPEFSDPLMQNVTIGYTMAEVSRVNMYALDKSSLIDLELCIADNKAQATFVAA